MMMVQLRNPTMRAAETNSRSLSDLTSASTIRATSIQLPAAMITTIKSGAGPQKRRERQQQENGWNSRGVLNDTHHQGAQPSAVITGNEAEQGTPTLALSTMAEMPISSEVCPATKRRAARSRPSGSVPKICAPVKGGANRARMSIVRSLKGKRRGPMMQASASSRITPTPLTARRFLKNRWALRFRHQERDVLTGIAETSVVMAITPDGRADR